MASNGTHAAYGGSGASRWMVCTGQPELTLQIAPHRNRETRYTLAGTHAHSVLSACILNGIPPANMTADESLIYSVQMAIDYVGSIAAEYDDLVVTTEEYLDFPQDVLPRDQVGGTPDLVLYSAKARRAWCIDFKHGEGVIVEVSGNRQLLFYATSYCHGKPIDDCVLVVIQPRAAHEDGPIREEVVTAIDMMEFEAEVDDVLRGPRVLVAGRHCKWCPAAPGCEAFEAASLASAREIFGGVRTIDQVPELPNPRTLSFDKIGRILERAPLFSDWLDACREYALEALRNGQHVPGFKAVEAQARRKWHGDPEHIAAELVGLSGAELHIDDVMPRKLVTITDATERLMILAARNQPRGQKGVAKEEVKRRIAYLTSKESSGNLTLAADTDSRPATNRAVQTFATVSLPPPEPPVSAPERVLSDGTVGYETIGGARVLTPDDEIMQERMRNAQSRERGYQSYADER
jgi:hypothetical protein